MTRRPKMRPERRSPLPNKPSLSPNEYSPTEARPDLSGNGKRLPAAAPGDANSRTGGRRSFAETRRPATTERNRTEVRMERICSSSVDGKANGPPWTERRRSLKESKWRAAARCSRAPPDVEGRGSASHPPACPPPGAAPLDGVRSGEQPRRGRQPTARALVAGTAVLRPQTQHKKRSNMVSAGLALSGMSGRATAARCVESHHRRMVDVRAPAGRGQWWPCSSSAGMQSCMVLAQSLGLPRTSRVNSLSPARWAHGMMSRSCEPMSLPV